MHPFVTATGRQLPQFWDPKNCLPSSRADRCQTERHSVAYREKVMDCFPVLWKDRGNNGRGRKTCGSDNRLIVGNRDNGGLADVNRNWHDNRNDNIGFRALAVLTANASSRRAFCPFPEVRPGGQDIFFGRARASRTQAEDRFSADPQTRLPV